MRLKIIIILTINLSYSQFTTTDYKIHNAGNVFQVQTNLWGQGYCHIMPLGPAQAHTVYPKNSRNQYTKWDENNGVEPSIGAKIGSPLAPVHVSSGRHENGYEF